MLNGLNQVEEHDYSKNIFIGKVVYNQDPMPLRRIKVSIPGLFEEQDHTTLPWVAPMFFGMIANGAGGGSAHLQPAVGSEVIVEFQMGSPLHGLYIASPIRPGQLPAEFTDADWQWTYGWKDPAGNLFLVNTKAGTNKIKIVHASGSKLEINNAGDLQADLVGKLTANVTGNADVTAAAVNVNNCNVNVTNGDVIADNISLKNHIHILPGAPNRTAGPTMS